MLKRWRNALLLKPRFGRRRNNGMLPPSVPNGISPPVRAPEPLVPRVLVLAAVGLTALTRSEGPVAGAVALGVVVMAAALVLWLARYRSVLAPDRAAA